MEVRGPLIDSPKDGETVIIKGGLVLGGVGGDASVTIGEGVACGDQYLNVPVGTDLSSLSPSPASRGGGGKGTIVFKGNVTLAKGSSISGGSQTQFAKK